MVVGNPPDDVQLVANPKKNFLAIMKDARIYKSSLSP
jgi:hypothetical protein